MGALSGALSALAFNAGYTGGGNRGIRAPQSSERLRS
jgi:hypothetical protein